MRCCSLCKQSKLFAEFYWRKDKGLYTARCRKCLVKPYDANKWKKWYETRGREKAFYSNIKKNYGLSADQYKKLLEANSGKCRICDSTQDLCVDHSHSTLKVRGLLCRKCNAGLGQFRDSKELLLKAASYLERI